MEGGREGGGKDEKGGQREERERRRDDWKIICLYFRIDISRKLFSDSDCVFVLLLLFAVLAIVIISY